MPVWTGALLDYSSPGKRMTAKSDASRQDFEKAGPDALAVTSPLKDSNRRTTCLHKTNKSCSCSKFIETGSKDTSKRYHSECFIRSMRRSG